MPRLNYLRDPDAVLSREIFGNEARPVNCAAVARKLKVDVRTVYNWRKQPTKMSIKHFVRLARVLGYDDDDIFRFMKELK
ncbi:MAG: helix-turn-helix transcriptional regulator [Lachnospiraceae bacterium]|nr:helix-turn-helix transcriptional regulator [Lachnospiraceae bacterium]